MGYFDDDVYYSPEKFGLKQIGMLSDPDADYSFSDLVVWQHEDGRLFYATDSGCSCPSPFEYYTSIESLTPITNDSWSAFEAEVKAFNDWGSDDDVPSRYQELVADKTQLLAKVSGLL